MAASPQMPLWTFYDKVRRLEIEGLISLKGQSEIYRPETWQLTKKGFEAILSDLGELKEKRFLPHSVPHDAYVLAFQMGDLVSEKHLDLHLFTEQEIRSYDADIHSELIPHSREHYPDGFTVRIEGNRKFIFGIEVELHLKSFDRYAQVLQYYTKTKAQVLWLCGSNYIAQRVRNEFSELSSRPENVDAHSFMLKDDFDELGWNARFISGSAKGKTMRELMLPTGNLPPTDSASTHNLPTAISLFLNTGKSPKILNL